MTATKTDTPTKPKRSKAEKPKTKTPKAKVPKAGVSWNRLTKAPLLHWIKRMKNPKLAESMPVHTKGFSVMAETLDEVARISVALDLMEGKCKNKDLQKSFLDHCSTSQDALLKGMPNYEYKIGGRDPIAKSKDE